MQKYSLGYDLPVDYTKLKPFQRRQVRLQYIEQQKGKCWYCGLPLTGKPSLEVQNKDIDLSLFPPNFLEHPIHLQHDHSTGMTEGAVHARCNAVLWQYEGQ